MSIKEGLLVALWLSLVICGSALGLNYEKTPEQTKTAADIFPPKTCLKLNKEGFTLVFFAHPKCPCTQASLHNLAGFLSEAKHVKAYACFMAPANFQGDWLEGANFNSAQNLHGLQLLVDSEQHEIRAFGASNSGETFLFDSNGRLRFHGGITAARGHEGDNDGLEALYEITGGRKDKAEYAVYGCALQNNELGRNR
ncbi:MAG: hypothetical protein K2X27_20255 [Candidatus Obscuribacterales bacterium]|nr:hypothetical protein [Candidatus Obscuribacterales bacterium]